MSFAAGFFLGALFVVAAFLICWAFWFYRDQLIWGRVRAAEKAAPAHEAVVLAFHRGART